MNIKTIQPMNNMVLVKPRIQNDRVICDSGVELFIDTTYEAEKHTNVVCDVIRVPNKLIFSRKYGNYVTMPHDVDLEVLPGDVAYCDYLSVQNAITNKFDGKGFIDSGELYILVHYQNIFMVLRDDVPIMCNGYVLIEPTYDELERIKSKGLVVPMSVEESMKAETQYGVVRIVGSRPRAYLDPKMNDIEFGVGDKVIFDRFADIPLEYSLHQTFQKGKTLFRVKRKDVLAVL